MVLAERGLELSLGRSALGAIGGCSDSSAASPQKRLRAATDAEPIDADGE